MVFIFVSLQNKVHSVRNASLGRNNSPKNSIAFRRNASLSICGCIPSGMQWDGCCIIAFYREMHPYGMQIVTHTCTCLRTLPPPRFREKHLHTTKTSRSHANVPPAGKVFLRSATRDYFTAPWTPSLSSFFRSVTSVSVVSIRPAILAALTSAVRTTLSGSMMPALYMSTYLPTFAS